MENYVDPRSQAENAGNVSLSRTKFNELRDNVLHIGGMKKIYYNKQFRRIDQYLQSGDTQPAVVVSTSPLVISAYSDEMDAVVFLKFPDVLAERYGLSVGTRLVTSNIYFEGKQSAKDIRVGSGYLNQYMDFTPVVQLFLCDSEAEVQSRAEIFDAAMWNRVQQLTEEKQANKPKYRDGFYYLTKFSLLFLIF